MFSTRIAFVVAVCSLWTTLASAGLSGQVARLAPGIVRSSDGLEVSLKSAKPGISKVNLEGVNFDKLEVEGTAIIGSAGGPGLPAWTHQFEVPTGFDPVIEFTSGAPSITSGMTLMPIPATGSDNPDNNLSSFDSDLYQQNQFFPANPAWISEVFSVGAKRYAVLTVSPWRYNPAEKILEHYTDLNASVSYRPGENSGSIQRSSDPVWDQLADALGDTPVRDRVSVSHDNLGHLVIFVPNENGYVNALQPLVDWKRRKGFMVTLVRLGDGIEASTAGIQGYLADAWSEWEVPPTYVLLVGDVNMPYFSDGQARQASWYVTDNKYVNFDGEQGLNSWIPEALIGRLPAANAGEATQMVSKILGYEKNPFLQQNWVEGAVLIAAGVHSCIETNQAVKALLVESGFNPNRFSEAYSEYHLGQVPDHNIISSGVDNGVGFVNFRGYNNWGNYTVAQIRDRRNGWKLPVVLGMVCATNDFPNQQAESIGEAWLRAWQNEARGAVACWGPTDLYTHTWFNNTMDGEFFRLLTTRGVDNLGALTLGAKLSLIRNYPSSLQLANGQSVGYYFFTYTLFGDPSMQVWSRQPRRLEVTAPEELPRGARNFSCSVNDADGEPVAGAFVHLFLDEEAHFGAFTDENGEVNIETSPLESGEYNLTVTARNFAPFLDDVGVAGRTTWATLDRFLIDDDNDGDSRGNSDGFLNPGELVELVPVISNTGSEDLSQLTVRLASDSPFCTVRRGSVEIENLQDGESAESETSYLVELGYDAWRFDKVDLQVLISSEDDQFRSEISLPVSGYRFEVVSAATENGELVAGESKRVTVTLKNTGAGTTPEISGTIYCSDPSIQLRQAETSFPELRAGGESGSRRSLEIAIPPGSSIGEILELGLLLQDGNGSGDSVTFTLQLGRPSMTVPQGPDKYGYLAIDDRDTAHYLVPEYENLRGDVNLQLTDNNDAATPLGVGGSLRTVDLPFEFIFYGRPYRQVTISTNGWLAFGQSVLVNWNNQELGSGLAPAPMIAPWWDDIHSGSVMVRNDEENARYIIEWRGFRNSWNAELSFAVALYNPNSVITRSGDGEILVTYATIPLLRDIPEEQATIGISSHDRVTNLTVRHARTSDPRSAELDSRSAILFTTGRIVESGSLGGTIRDAATGAPLRNVRVMIDGTGFFGVTGEDGTYEIPEIIVGTYRALARKTYFNDNFSEEFEIRDGERIEFNAELTHPTFTLDVERLDLEFPVDTTVSRRVGFSNHGNGPLEYRVDLSYVPTEEGFPARWQPVYDFAISDSTGELNFRGVTTDGDHFYISGTRELRVFPHPIYVFDNNGSLVTEFDQFSVDSSTNRGYDALDFRDGNISAVEEDNIVYITTDGQLIEVIPNHSEPGKGIVWMPERQTYLTKTLAGNRFYEFDAQSNLVREIPIPEQSYRVYGMVWHPEDKDGMNVYILRLSADNATVIIDKMNIETLEFRQIAALPVIDWGTPLDLTISNGYDSKLWTLAILFNRQGGDHLVGFMLEPNFTWMTFAPESGTVGAGESSEFEFEFTSSTLRDGRYDMTFDIVHNAEGDHFALPLNIRVGETAVEEPEPEALPSDFRIVSVYPNPFNAVTRVSFQLPVSQDISYVMTDISGREVLSRDLGTFPAGHHSLAIDGKDLGSGLYIIRLKSPASSISGKVLLLK